ncbi:MAG: DNA/RNA nuclease SfsA [Candidatus Bathyarchaeota archaeon]|nr:DNA/RNA nuclease SfsA [Candidatus Bathyarchaeota archaeon]
MRFSGRLVPAVFQSRPNRFLGVVLVDGVETLCFIPNPGRMKELIYRGARVYLIAVQSDIRKTRYNLTLVDHQGTLVSVDSNVPNKVVSEAVDRGIIEPFEGFRVKKAEYTFGESRLDFLLESDSGNLLLEVKSCTLIRDGVALFPDAPTKRGSRHLLTLTRGLTQGRSAVFFLIQRSDANSFRPNMETDPDFAANLEEANRKGVKVYAYSSRVTFDGVFLGSRVPIDL